MASTYKQLLGSVSQLANDAVVIGSKSLNLAPNEAIQIKQIEVNVDPITAKFWYAATAIDLRLSFSIGNTAPAAPINIDNPACIYAVNLAHQTASQIGMNSDVLMYKYEIPVYFNVLRKGNFLFAALDTTGTAQNNTVYYRITYKVVTLSDLSLVWAML